MTVISVFFSFPSNFVFNSQDILITAMKLIRTHTHTHTVHSHPQSCISFQPCRCHPYTFPSPQLTQAMHSKDFTQPSCWSPVSTTALNLILWHSLVVSLCRQDAPVNLLNAKGAVMMSTVPP